MAAEANIIRYMITGGDDEVIPRNATHVSVHPSVKIIPRRLFDWHRNIVELICHDGVIKIEHSAFFWCPRLKRVILKGVEEVEWGAFQSCRVLEYVECDKLEIIGRESFAYCISMTSFNLPSAKIVLKEAFWGCDKLKYAKFGKKLESFDDSVFYNCSDLERITIPLKNSLIQHDDTFQLCGKLKQVDFVEEAELQETIDALLRDEWRNDMNAEIDSINQTLPDAYQGHGSDDEDDDADYGDDSGEKARVIRFWVANVLRKIVHYKSLHRRLLREAACRLQLSLPHDIVMNNVVPFLMLPQHTFDGEIEGDDGELDMDCNDEGVDKSHKSRLDNEDEEDENEGSVGEDADDVIEEVTRNGEGRKRRKTANADDLDGEND